MFRFETGLDYLTYSNRCLAKHSVAALPGRARSKLRLGPAAQPASAAIFAAGGRASRLFAKKFILSLA